MDGGQPSKLADIFWGGIEGVYGPQRAPFSPATMLCHTLGVFLGPYTPSTAPKIIPACLVGCRPSIQHIRLERKASCGALGGHFCRRRPWSAMVVLVDVGHWRLTSDQPTVGIVAIVYKVFFLRRSHTFMTSDPEAKKGRL
jgi:hypothetical protein